MKARIRHAGDRVRIELVGEGLARDALPDGAELEALLAPGTVVATDGEGAFFGGSISAFDAAELLSLLNAGGRSGVLSVRDAEARRAVYLRGGEVVFAASSGPGERLGEVLVYEGRLSRAELERLEMLVQPGRKLGQVLVHEGVLQSAELFAGVALQIRTIVLALFDVSEGVFLFDEGEVSEQTAVRLEESTRDLVVAGIRRGEERHRLLQKLGGENAPLGLVGAPSRKLTPREEALLTLFQEGDTVGTLLARRPFARTEAVKAIAGLVDVGALSLIRGAPPPPETRLRAVSEAARYLDALDVGSGRPATPTNPAPGPAGPGRAFEAYGRAIRHIVARLKAQDPAAARGLSSFFARPPRTLGPILAGLSLGEDGALDMEKLLANARAAHGHEARSRALEALDSVVAFCLFEAKNVLPKDAAAQLVQEVGRIQMGREP